MLAIALLVFREVLEAALLIGVVTAATRGFPHRGRAVGWGISVGIMGAIAIAAGAQVFAASFSGSAQDLLDAGILLAAVVLIGWHVIWMSSHGHKMALEMKQMGQALHSQTRPLRRLGLVVALAVLREGSEVVLFLYGMAAGGAHGLWPGLALGLMGGVAAGLVLYHGLVRIPLKSFFTWTNALLILMAAGLAADAMQFLSQANWLTWGGNIMWDTSRFLHEGTLVGQTAHVLLGYVARPSQAMLTAYLITAGILGGAAAWARRR